MLLAETVLMASGLVAPPTATHVRAARALLDDLRDQLLAALEREEPGRLFVCPERAGYFDRLAREPDLAAAETALEPLIGTEAADAYTVLHQAARRTLLDLRPSSTIDTVLGPKVLPLDSISEARWALEVDTVEGMRIMKELAAGALLKEEVDVFAACFPESYAYLLGELDLQLAKKAAAAPTWEPPMWLADSLRIFERKPFGASLELTAAKSPPPTSPPKRGKSEIDTEALKTKSQGGEG
jgi:hypothetical protein